MTLALADPELFADAPCVGHPHLFEARGDHEPLPELERRHQAAVQLCTRCLVTTECAALLETLPPTSRFGVWAGVSNEVTAVTSP